MNLDDWNNETAQCIDKNIPYYAIAVKNRFLFFDQICTVAITGWCLKKINIVKFFFTVNKIIYVIRKGYITKGERVVLYNFDHTGLSWINTVANVIKSQFF